MRIATRISMVPTMARRVTSSAYTSHPISSDVINSLPPAMAVRVAPASVVPHKNKAIAPADEIRPSHRTALQPAMDAGIAMPPSVAYAAGKRTRTPPQATPAARVCGFSRDYP